MTTSGGFTITDFPRQARLLNKIDFDRVIRQADKRVRVGSLQALAKSNDLDHPRIGLIIAKRHLRLAVQRNRVKRLLRESFRRTSTELPNVDLVVRLLAKPDMVSIAGDISRMFGKMLPSSPSATPGGPAISTNASTNKTAL